MLAIFNNSLDDDILEPVLLLNTINQEPITNNANRGYRHNKDKATVYEGKPRNRTFVFFSGFGRMRAEAACSY